MNISMWISIIALLVSIIALIHTLLSSQSNIRITLSAKRNSLRVDVHEESMKLLSLIDKIIKEPQSDQHIKILDKMVDTAKGLVSIYQDLEKISTVPWRMQTIAATKYDYIAAKLQEFERVFDRAQASFEEGDLKKLESITEGMHNRIWGSSKESEHQIFKPETDIASN